MVWGRDALGAMKTRGRGSRDGVAARAGTDCNLPRGISRLFAEGGRDARAATTGRSSGKLSIMRPRAAMPARAGVGRKVRVESLGRGLWTRGGVVGGEERGAEEVEEAEKREEGGGGDGVFVEGGDMCRS